MDRVQTGIDELDEILAGGLPAGSLAVLAGPPGTGKTILAQQLCFSGASDDHPALGPLAAAAGMADADFVFIPVGYKPAIPFALVIIMLLFRPQGLLGGRRA